MLCEFYNEKLEFQENLLVKYYCKHNYEVVVVTSTYNSVFDYYNNRNSNKDPERVYYDNCAKIIKLKYKLNILYKLRVFKSIKKILSDEQPDLIYLHDIMLNIPECVDYMRSRKNVRMIMDYHADYSNSGKNWLSISILHGIIRKWYLDKARPYLSKIFPIVPDGMKFLNEVYKVPNCEMEVLPLGADLDLINEIKLSNSKLELRKKLGYKKCDKIVFTGGKLLPRKRTEILIDAILSAEIPMKLIIIGDSDENDLAYKQSLIDKVGINQNIKFTGWLGTVDIYKYMIISDLAVFPACQSIIWQQAIAVGLPLIGGNKGHQHLDYLRISDCIINPELSDLTPERLMRMITSLFQDESKLTNMRNNTKIVTKELLDWNEQIKKTVRYNI